MANKIHVLHNGYSKMPESSEDSEVPFCHANCTSTLVTGSATVVIDTMTPWDANLLTKALNDHGISPDNVDYVVCTHGHSDHIGNNHLFTNAKKLIVGFCVSHKDKYFFHPFENGRALELAPGIRVVPTPGHTLDDVSVVVETEDLGKVIIAGDIFEKEEDIANPEIWRSQGGSADPEKQERVRWKLLLEADYIIPGHGPMFKVTETMRELAKKYLSSQ